MLIRTENNYYVDKKDFENPSLDPLPVLRGCSGFACGCSGACMVVVGHIPRKDYEQHLKYEEMAKAFAELATIKLSSKDDQRW
jgi:hypothetical protein